MYCRSRSNDRQLFLSEPKQIAYPALETYHGVSRCILSSLNCSEKEKLLLIHSAHADCLHDTNESHDKQSHVYIPQHVVKFKIA